MKLSQYILRVVVMGIVSLGASQAWAYSHNYTCENGRNACDGAQAEPIAWDRSCVLFYLDEGGSNDFEDGPDAEVNSTLEQIVKQAFATWTAPECSGLELIYGGTRDPQDQQDGERRNMVVFDQDGWSSASATTFATTIVNYNPRTGEIREADIEVNDQFYRFANQSTPRPGEADLLNTLTHEVGHFLGMAHSDVAAATMFGSADLGETKKRTLHSDDISGLCAHYPADEFSSSCGMGDDDHDGGKGSFQWGDDSDPAASESACSVTQLGASAMMEPILLIVGLFGGVLWRRRSRRNNDA